MNYTRCHGSLITVIVVYIYIYSLCFSIYNSRELYPVTILGIYKPTENWREPPCSDSDWLTEGFFIMGGLYCFVPGFDVLYCDLDC